MFQGIFVYLFEYAKMQEKLVEMTRAVPMSSQKQVQARMAILKIGGPGVMEQTYITGRKGAKAQQFCLCMVLAWAPSSLTSS